MTKDEQRDTIISFLEDINNNQVFMLNINANGFNSAYVPTVGYLEFDIMGLGMFRNVFSGSYSTVTLYGGNKPYKYQISTSSDDSYLYYANSIMGKSLTGINKSYGDTITNNEQLPYLRYTNYIGAAYRAMKYAANGMITSFSVENGVANIEVIDRRSNEISFVIKTDGKEYLQINYPTPYASGIANVRYTLNNNNDDLQFVMSLLKGFSGEEKDQDTRDLRELCHSELLSYMELNSLTNQVFKASDEKPSLTEFSLANNSYGNTPSIKLYGRVTISLADQYTNRYNFEYIELYIDNAKKEVIDNKTIYSFEKSINGLSVKYSFTIENDSYKAVMVLEDNRYINDDESYSYKRTMIEEGTFINNTPSMTKPLLIADEFKNMSFSLTGDNKLIGDDKLINKVSLFNSLSSIYSALEVMCDER